MHYINYSNSSTLDRHSQQNALKIYNYTCASATACKSLWQYAIAQHTFYLDTYSRFKRQGKVS